MIRKIKSLLFKNHSDGQTVIKNTFWLFAGEIIGRVLRIVVVIYAAGLLGAAGYGVFSYVMATAGLITILSDVGISAVLTRESVKYPEQRKQYFATALALKGVLIIINICIVIFILPRITTVAGAAALFPFVAFILAFDTLRDFGAGMLRALQKMELEALAKIIMNLAIASLGLFLVTKHATTTSLATGYVIGTSVGFFITLAMLWPYFKGLFAHFEPKLVKGIIGAAWPIGLIGLMGAITLNTDMIMLGQMRTPAELGYYAAAQKPIQFLYIIPGLLATGMFPLFAKLAHESKEKLRGVLERSAVMSLLIAMPIVFGGLIVAPQLIDFLYTAEFVVPAIPSFRLLLITLLINAPALILNNVILAYNKQLSFLRFFAVGAISNVIFNALLIPRYGIVGAALATILAQITSNACIWYAIRRLASFNIIQYLGKITLAALLMAAATFGMQLLGFSFFINLGISALVYFGLLLLMKEPLLREARSLLKTPH